MYTSQKHSSLVLIRLRFYWDVSSLAEITVQNLRKKKQTPTHTSNCTGRCLQLCWLTHGGKKELFKLSFFSSLFLHDVVSGLLSAIARMELCDTAWPLTYCDELWVYLLRLLISTYDGRRTEPGLGKDKEDDEHPNRETDISTDRPTERQADRQITTDR